MDGRHSCWSGRDPEQRTSVGTKGWFTADESAHQTAKHIASRLSYSLRARSQSCPP